MRELAMDELEIVTGGVLGADGTTPRVPVLGEVGDVAAAVASTIGAGILVATTPALAPIVVVGLGFACGVYLADELADVLA